MQPISWYLHRLGSMSLGEISWRLSSLVRDGTDRLLIPIGAYPRPAPLVCDFLAPGFSVSPGPIEDWRAEASAEWKKQAAERLFAQADQIVVHRLSYFSLHDHDHGHPFDWHRDHASGKQAPLDFASSINYRDFLQTGDCKLVWEPNRHHHLVVLGRAYRASGLMCYAEAVRAQILSWLDANPYGHGMNWRSPMELAIRLINWVWAIDLIRDSGLVTGEFLDRLYHGVFLHLHDVTRKYSQGSSANNHLIGEAAGVFIACCYFSDLPDGNTWRQQSFAILCREMDIQVTAEGCHRELALGYHFFVLQFFLFAGLAGRKSDMEFPASYWDKMEQMFAFLSCLAEGGKPPLFGDCDDGYVLNLGNTPHDPAPLLAVGAALFHRADFKELAGDAVETLYWLLGEGGVNLFQQMATERVEKQLCSRSFPEAGLYLLQHGTMKSQQRASVLIDCGELGFKSIAAHGHADALSFTLRVGGKDVLVDPGTYDYFTFPEWRTYFRSTRAHNTMEVDDEDQSVMLGPFLWGKRAQCRCLVWQPTDDGGKFVGEHDGYTRLKDPVLHRRTVELTGGVTSLAITDVVEAKNMHRIRFFFHCAPDGHIEENGAHGLRITLGNVVVNITFDPIVESYTLIGSENPIGGWMSNNYHCKEGCCSIIAEVTCNGTRQFRTDISWDIAEV